MTHPSDIGELISLFYTQFLAQYGDAELASVATARLINDMLTPASSSAPRFAPTAAA